MKQLVLACMLLALSAGVSDARMRRVIPLHVRIVAYVGAKPEGVRPDFSWTVTYKGERYQLYVVNLLVLSGNATPSGINAALAPYQVKFQMVGEKTALQRFVAAPPLQQVLMTGYLRLDPAGRFLMLDTVDAAYLPTPSPAAGG
jgi:hypothetical protein